MNKGFAYYFKHALKCAVGTVWKNKNVIKSMWYFFMSVFARLTVVLGALVSLADVRQAKIAKNQRTVDIPQSLTKASQRSMWTMIVAGVLEMLIYVGGFLLLSIVCGAIMAVGWGITSFVDKAQTTIILIVFAVPCLIIYLVYTIIILVMFAPTAYVVDSNPSLSAGDVVSVCISTMKSRGKGTVILCVLVPTLIMLGIAAICGGGIAAIILLLGKSEYLNLIILAAAIVSAVALGLTIPMFVLAKNISLVLLFEDIALDPVNANKRTAGINIKKINGARVDREEAPDNLSALFDDGIEEKYPDAEELVHKHKKKKKKVAPKSQPQAAQQAAQPQPQQPETKQPASQPVQPPVEGGAEPPEPVQTLEEMLAADDYADELPKEPAGDTETGETGGESTDTGEG